MPLALLVHSAAQVVPVSKVSSVKVVPPPCQWSLWVMFPAWKSCPGSLWSLDSWNWSQETLSVSLCLCHFLLDPWILGSLKSRILKYGAQNQLCLYAGSLDPWIPGSLDSQNWSQEALSVSLCVCHFLFDPWILGSLYQFILRFSKLEPRGSVCKIVSVFFFAGSLDPWIP